MYLKKIQAIVNDRTKLREALQALGSYAIENSPDKLTINEIKRKITEFRKDGIKLSGHTYNSILSLSAKGKGGQPFYLSTKMDTFYNILYFYFAEFELEYDFQNNKVIEAGAMFYDGFYFRTKDNSTGLLKIRINNWKTGKLRFYYRSEFKPFRDFDLEFEDLDFSKDFKRAVFRDINGISGALVLCLSIEEVKRNYTRGILTYFNYDHKAINSSHLILQKDEDCRNIDTSSFLSDFEGGKRKFVNIPGVFEYFLNNRNLVLDSNVILEREKFKGFIESETLDALAGTYRSVHIPFQPESYMIKVYEIHLTKGGFATHKKGENVKDYGIAKIVNQKLYIYFSKGFRPTESTFESLFFDNTTYLLIFDISNTAILEGHFVGIINDQVSSGPIILEPQTNTSIGVKKEQYLDDLKKTLKNTTKAYPYFDKYLKSFVTAVEKQEDHLKTKIPESLKGDYSCYFNFRRIKNGEPDVSRYGPIFHRMPVNIEDTVTVKYGPDSREHTGSVAVAGGDHTKYTIQVNFYEINFFGSMIFQFEKSEDLKKYERLYGILTIYHKGAVESAAFVCINNSDIDSAAEYKHDTFKTFSTIDKIMEQEHITKGAATKITGSWNRNILMNETVNEKFDIRKSAYRRVFWNSAMYRYYSAVKIKRAAGNPERVTDLLKEARYDLFRAYFHGFGMKQFADIGFDEKRFPVELKEEVVMSEEFYRELIDDKSLFAEDTERAELHNKIISSLVNLWGPFDA